MEQLRAFVTLECNGEDCTEVHHRPGCQLYQPRRYYVDDCPACFVNERKRMGPPHDPSDMCESGWHTHCTCDYCF